MGVFGGTVFGGSGQTASTVGVPLLSIMQRAYRIAGITKWVGTTQQDDWYDEARAEMNAMIGGWNLNRLNIFTIAITNTPLIPGRKSYTVGPGADFDMPRPQRIENGVVLLGLANNPPAPPSSGLALSTLTDEQLATLTDEQLATLTNTPTPSGGSLFLSTLTNDQLAMLTDDQLAALTNSPSGSVTPSGVSTPNTSVVRMPPMYQMNDAEWALISLQNVRNGIPLSFYYDGSYDTTTGYGLISLWPQTTSAYSVDWYAWQSIPMFQSKDDTVALPFGYEDMLVYCLAERLANLNPHQQKMTAESLRQAAKCRAAIQKYNAPLPKPFQNDAACVGNTRSGQGGRFDYRVGFNRPSGGW